MVNVRIDAQGVPKGPVYEWTAPVLHRQVTAVDADDPTSRESGIDGAGYRSVRFDIDASQSVDLSYLKVQLLVWNEAAGRFFRGAEREFQAAEIGANPYPSLEAEIRGATVFLKVVSATATSLALSIYASLS